MKLDEGVVAVLTGAARGIGRAQSLEQDKPQPVLTTK